MRIHFYILIIIGVFLISSCSNDSGNDHSKEGSQTDAISVRVEKILSGLTLQDKVGEMTQLNFDMLAVGEPYNLENPHRFDEAKMRKALVDLKVGSILNCGGHAYTLEQWHDFINHIQKIASEKESGIPVLYGIDAIHGTTYTLGGTLFPQQIGLAATWNPSLAYEMGRITAYETRASGIPWTFSPVLDIGRDPRWPRIWETFGEDPLLAGDLGVSLVDGYQGEDVSDSISVAACLKHFVGYSTPLSGKDRTQAWIPERQMREYFLPTFQRAIDAGAKTIMVNSGEVNGIAVHINDWILQDLLRDELGFDGLVLTDWEDIKYLYTRHRVAKDYKEAIKLAIDAGIDMSMVPVDLEFPILLKELVEEGEIAESRLDESVRRILRLKIELGLFESEEASRNGYEKFGSEEHRLASLKAAKESITLLKNENKILPLKKDLKVLLLGPTANSLNCLNGGWTGTWQGADPTWNTPGKKTLKDALEEEIGSNLIYVDWESRFSKELAEADVVLLAIGEQTYTETVGDIEDLSMPNGEILKLFEFYKEKPIIGILIEGRPRTFDFDFDALLMAYLPGNEGGEAITSVLFGETNPSGKLPFTYPRHASSFTTYDHKTTDLIDPQFGMNAFNPLFEFGHGLSYTDFEYSDFSINVDSMKMEDSIEFSVKVKNTGNIDGKEVVQLYIRDEVASIVPSVKRLRAYDKIELKSGEEKIVEFTITSRDLSFVGRGLNWVTEEGEFSAIIQTDTLQFNLVK